MTAMEELKAQLKFSRDTYPLHIKDWKQAFSIIEILIDKIYLEKEKEQLINYCKCNNINKEKQSLSNYYKSKRFHKKYF